METKQTKDQLKIKEQRSKLPLDQQFTKMVIKLVKDPSEIADQLTTFDVDLLHAILGIASEAGEMLDNVKKRIIYRKTLDIQNLKEELGDLEFYMEQLRQIINVTREETLKLNMEKLALRYKDYNYSNEQAIARKDKENEQTTT